MFLLVSAVLAAPHGDVRPAPRNALDLAFTDAATEFEVPRALLMAIGWEKTRWNPDAVSAWGGWGMYDLREGDTDPSLEHAARLLELDPNVVGTDWRQSIRGAAAILADQARLANGGVLPPSDDLLAWTDAVKAFSGREEPIHQQLYVRAVYRIAAEGALADTRWGTVVVPPQDVEPPAAPVSPPAGDTSLADQFYAACSDNYSDYSRGAGDIDMVVIHTVQGSYSGCYSWFANCSAGASAHYVVRSSDGAVTQMVYEADVGWHAGNWDYNERSIGIEHEGYVDDPGTWYTDAMYASSAALVVDIAARQGVSLSRSYIIGHDEVPDPYNPGEYGGAGHHTDPGDGWDWDYFMSLVNGETGTTGGEILGVVADSDIYNGERLVGATVWIAETGDTTTVGSDGYYRFEDVPFGTYTMHASLSGYAEGTCGPKEHSTEQSWCSIALMPDGSDDTGDVEDSGTPDTGGDDTAVDTGPPGDGDAPLLPGAPVRMDETGGCGCAAPAAPLGWLLALGAVPLALLRRRR